MKRTAIFFILILLAAGCEHHVQVSLPPPPPSGPSPYELAFADGITAFRRGTAEGYQQAAVSFRKALDMNKTGCEPALHLAESLYFLAREQKLNWDDFRPNLTAANAVIDPSAGGLDCSSLPAYTLRLRALKGTVSGTPNAGNVALIRQAVALMPDDPMNWLVLTQLQPGRLPGDSLPPIEHAAQLAPDLPVVQYEKGNYYLGLQIGADNFNIAKAAFQRTLELSPRHYLALIGISYTLIQEGDDAATQTLSLLQKALEIAPDSVRVRTTLGDYYAGYEEIEKAVEQYKAATDRNPNYYPGFLSMGVTLSGADRTGESEQAFRNVLALDPANPHPPLNMTDPSADAQAHYYLGEILLEREDLVRARSEFTSSLAAMPVYTLAIYGLGIVSYQEGKSDEALQHLNDVIRINDEMKADPFPNAYLVRGGIYGDRHQFPESLRDLDTSIQLYDHQAAQLEAKAVTDDAKGFKRRAEAERKRAGRMRGTLEKAGQTKALVIALRDGAAKKQP